MVVHVSDHLTQSRRSLSLNRSMWAAISPLKKRQAGRSQVVESTTFQHLWVPEYHAKSSGEVHSLKKASRGVDRQKRQLMPYAKAYQLVLDRLARLFHRHNAEVHSASGVQEPAPSAATRRLHRLRQLHHHGRGFKLLQVSVEAVKGPFVEYATWYEPAVQRSDSLEPLMVVLDAFQGAADLLDGL